MQNIVFRPIFMFLFTVSFILSCQISQAMDKKTGQLIIDNALDIESWAGHDYSSLTDDFIEKEGFRTLVCVSKCQRKYEDSHELTKASDAQKAILNLIGRNVKIPRNIKYRGQYIEIDCGDGVSDWSVKYRTTEENNDRIFVIGDVYNIDNFKSGSFRVAVHKESSSPFGYVIDGIIENGGMIEYYEGEMLENKMDWKNAFKSYQKAISKGNFNAIAKFGLLYEYGNGVKQDKWKARELFEEAVKKNDDIDAKRKIKENRIQMRDYEIYCKPGKYYDSISCKIYKELKKAGYQPAPCDSEHEAFIPKGAVEVK